MHFCASTRDVATALAANFANINKSAGVNTGRCSLDRAVEGSVDIGQSPSDDTQELAYIFGLVSEQLLRLRAFLAQVYL